MTKPVIREVSNVLHAHGTRSLLDLPEDEFDCCVEEMVDILWEHFQAEAVKALEGAYTNPSINQTFQNRIRKMKSPA